MTAGEYPPRAATAQGHSSNAGRYGARQLCCGFDSILRLGSMLMLLAISAVAQDSLLERAAKALENKDYSQTITLLQQHLEGNSKDYRAWFNLGYAYTLQGNKDQAIEAYRKTLQIEPKLFEAMLNLGILLLEANRVSEAMPRLAEAAQTKPENFRAALLCAQALSRAGERAAAIEQYQKALALNSDSAAAHLGLGRLWVEEKRYDAAEQEISRAVELDIKDSRSGAELEMARLYELTGRQDRALQIYIAYLQQHPDSVEVLRRLGILYLQQKKSAEAIQVLEQANQRESSIEGRRNLARAYAQARRPDDALPHLKELRESFPNDFEISLLLGQMLLLKRDFEGAQAHLFRAMRLRPELPDTYVDLANAFYLQERYAETVAVLDRLGKLGPERQTPWSTFLRAISLDKLGQAEPALESYQRFLSLDSGKYPDQEFQARQRIKALHLVLEKQGKRKHK